MNDQELYKRAQERVQQLRGFYIHAAIYVFVNHCLLLINLLTSPSSLWFYWTTLFCGIGLTAHSIAVFVAGGTLGKEWEERKIRQIMEQERGRYPSQPSGEYTGGGDFNE